MTASARRAGPISANENTAPAIQAPAAFSNAELRKLIAFYARPSHWMGLRDLALTMGPFLALLGLLFWGIRSEVWAALLLAPLAAAFLVRLFIIQHDCGHGSYFKSRWANNMLGRILGVLTLTPYADWRRDHAIHHATSGNLDKRGVGDITTWTAREYLSQTPWKRFLYRLYRHPVVLFLVGPAWQFLIRHRLPRLGGAIPREIWFSVMGTNLALAAGGTLIVTTLGWQSLVLGYVPVIVLAGSMGIWLFYVQHQFEETYWEPQREWDFTTAAIEGCSHYDLPWVLDWLSGHIGFHALHHMASLIPSYRLRAAFRSMPVWRSEKRLGMIDSLRCARLALWDEAQRKLVSFAEVRRQQWALA